MTGRSASTRKGNGSEVSFRSGYILGFGPDDSLTPDPGVLYDEQVPKEVYARSGFIEEIGKGLIRGIKKVAERRNTFGRPWGIEKILKIGPYGALPDGRDVGAVEVKPADQETLSALTGIKKYLYGAAVNVGRQAGIYIDEKLLGNALEYTKLYAKGRLNDAKEFAGDFVEALKTIGHEFAHYELGITDEVEAERYGQSYLEMLASEYKPIWEAVKNAYTSVTDGIQGMGSDAVSRNFTPIRSR